MGERLSYDKQGARIHYVWQDPTMPEPNSKQSSRILIAVTAPWLDPLTSIFDLARL